MNVTEQIESPTCPECERAEMRRDDHVFVCPACDYETSEIDTPHDTTWGFSHQLNGWQAVCRTCKWLGEPRYAPERAREDLIEHIEGLGA